MHGKPRQPQSQGFSSVEWANRDIKDMLVAWLNENRTTDWATGIKVVQFAKDSTGHHTDIGRSPCRATLGTEAKLNRPELIVSAG